MSQPGNTLSFYDQINLKHYYDSNRDRTHKIQTPFYHSFKRFTKYFTKTCPIPFERNIYKFFRFNVLFMFSHVYDYSSCEINYNILYLFSSGLWDSPVEVMFIFKYFIRISIFIKLISKLGFWLIHFYFATKFSKQNYLPTMLHNLLYDALI